MKIAKLKNSCLPADRENSERGFTLVEIIVALGIFVTAVTIALGALIGLYNANNKSQSLSSVINNLNYSIENMAKTIRFAANYHCGSGGALTAPQSCNSGDTFLAISTNLGVIIYRFNVNKLETSLDGGATYTPLTADEVTVQSAKFYVFNTIVGDNFQPYVLLTVKGFAGKNLSAQSTFDIETTVSQRELDI
ncbi:MAG: type II secretion system protein [Patescibacteria group bacterium]